MDDIGIGDQPNLCGGEAQVATFTSIANHVTTPPPRKVKPFLGRVERSEEVKAYMGDAARANAYELLTKDVKELPLMELAAKYPGEYNSHRGAKRSPKSRGIPFDPRLSDFRNWLIHLGPKLGPEYTADRINIFEGYKPGNLRYASKTKQTENRRSTRWVKLPDGSRVKAKQLAFMAGRSYHTVRKQLERGWPVERILEQKGSGDPIRDWKFPVLSREELEREYRKRAKVGQYPIDWLIEHLQHLEHLATDAGHASHAIHLQVRRDVLIGQRERLKVQANDNLYRKVDALLDALTHEPAKPSPLPKLPAPPSAEIKCTAVKVPKKLSEPKATLEEVLAAMQRQK